MFPSVNQSFSPSAPADTIRRTFHGGINVNNPNSRGSIAIAFSLNRLSGTGQPVRVHQQHTHFGTLTDAGFDPGTLVQAGRKLVNDLADGRKPSLTIKLSALTDLGHLLATENPPDALLRAELFDERLRTQPIQLAIGFLLAALEAAQPNIIARSGNDLLVMAAITDGDLVTIQFLREEAKRPAAKSISATGALMRGQMHVRQRDALVRA